LKDKNINLPSKPPSQIDI